LNRHRFREAALLFLDDAYTLARYLLREPPTPRTRCRNVFLRAFKHFDSYRGPAMSRGCSRSCAMSGRAEYARRKTAPTTAIEDVPESAEQAPAVARSPGNPEAQILRRWDSDTTAGWWQPSRTVPGDLCAA